ncbi:MAG: methylmalonyl-CoA mutase family protein, partial [Pseudomonadota bacterium]|nr:methylmalonyl-CoA mutase family protein [Pseudomonadota bacterium]
AWESIKEKESNGGILNLINSKAFRESLKNSRDDYKNKILEKKLIKVGENSYKDPDSNPISVKPFENNSI